MKKCLTLCLFAMALLFSFNSNAQLADGSIAPNFTATDIDGNTWDLYEILESGKSVVLDISATWCGPCWSYHNGGNLETLYETYGPDGTDEMMVFFIEGDASTTLEDLNGTGSNTLGDWVTGTEYPIIDDAAIFSAFECTYFPTIFHICPNKQVTLAGQAAVNTFYDLHNSCATSVGVNNARLADLSGLDGCVTGDVTISANIQNLGSSSLSSAELELTVNGSSEQVINWTGSLDTWGSDDVSFNPVSIAQTDVLEVTINNVNGGADDDPSDNSLSTSEVVNSTFQTLEFRMVTDKWPDEISWEVTDESGAVLYSNPTLECETEYIFSYQLPADGCYQLNITDDYGDGLLNGQINPASHSCTNGDVNYAIGLIEIGNADGDLFWNDNDYGSELELTFVNSNTSSVQSVDGLSEVSLFPNPVSDLLNVHFSVANTSQMQMEIVNALGQTVKRIDPSIYATGNHSLNINTASLTNGIYFFSMMADGQVTTKKFTVSK